MTRRINVPTFLGGISQQTHGQRQPNLVDDAFNIEFLATEGATKRYPSEHVTKLSESNLSGAKLVTLERDDGEYAVVINSNSVRVRNLDGTSATVSAPSGFGYLTGASETDLRTTNIADATVILNRAQVVAGAAGATKQSWVQPGEASIFVKAGNFGDRYTLRIKTAGMFEEEIIEYVTPAEPGLQVGGNFGSVGTSFNITLTAGQADGSEPIVCPFTFQSPDECRFRHSGTTTVSPTEFRGIGRTRELFYNGPLAAGTQLEGRVLEHNIQWFIQTENILQSLLERIDAQTVGITAESDPNDSSARLSSTTAFEILVASDSQADSVLVAWRNEIPQFDDLPLVAKHGQVVTVRGLTADVADDFTVRFASTEWSEETERDFDLFDTFDGFGPGTWIETTVPDLPTGALDASTMPHILKRIDATTFEFTPIDWVARDAGDDDSNPEPSFVGESIRDIYFHQNRLGFLAQNSVILSESAEQFNFWRTTVVSLPDSDPIDIEAANLDGDVLNHAVPFNDRLIVFSRKAQASVFGTPFLSPQTVQAPVLSSYRAFSNVDPVLSGRSLFFGYSSGQFSQFREYIPTDRQDQFIDSTITVAAPKLVPSGVRRLTKASVDQQLGVLVEEDRKAMFLYQFYRQGGDLVQAAWTRWGFSGELIDVGYVQDRMVLVVLRDGETFLETMQLGVGRTEEDGNTIARIDRRTQATNSTYNRGTDTTSFQIDYTFDDEAPMRMVAGAGDVFPFGSEFFPVSTDGANRILTFRGDLTGQQMLAGEAYDSWLELSRPYAKQEGQRGQTQILGSSQTVRKLHVGLSNTGYLRAEVSFVGSPPAVEEFLVDRLDVGNLEPGVTREGELDIGIHSHVDEFKVRLINDTAAPSTITSGAWDIRLNVKYRLG